MLSVIDLYEGLENMFDLARWNAYAVVRHAHNDSLRLLFCADPYTRRFLFLKLDSVANQVEQNLLKTLGIGVHFNLRQDGV
jgi:hypothetical protein